MQPASDSASASMAALDENQQTVPVIPIRPTMLS